MGPRRRICDFETVCSLARPLDIRHIATCTPLHAMNLNEARCYCPSSSNRKWLLKKAEAPSTLRDQPTNINNRISALKTTDSLVDCCRSVKAAPCCFLLASCNGARRQLLSMVDGDAVSVCGRGCRICRCKSVAWKAPELPVMAEVE